MTRRIVREWRQAEPFRMTREDNFREVAGILLGLAVVLMWGLGIWLWAAILVTP